MKGKWDAVLGVYAAAGKASLALLIILLIGVAIHSFVVSRGVSPAENLPRTKAALASAAHVLFAIGVYWHLITGGWLTESYSSNDANLINPALAIFEVVAVGSVIAFWAMPKAATYWFMVDL